MIKKVSIGLVLLLSLWACEKDNNTNSQVEPNYFPMTTGSYWVYNTYEVDSVGNDSLISINDTVRVIGDTLIREEQYSVFRGKAYGFSERLVNKYYRDSLGYVVSSSGSIVLQDDVTNDKLNNYYEGDSSYRFYNIISKETEPIEINHLSYNDAYKNTLLISYLTEINKPIKELYGYLVPNIGFVSKQYAYVNQLISKGVFYEDRLVTYYIAP